MTYADCDSDDTVRIVAGEDWAVFIDHDELPATVDPETLPVTPEYRRWPQRCDTAAPDLTM